VAHDISSFLSIFSLFTIILLIQLILLMIETYTEMVTAADVDDDDARLTILIFVQLSPILFLLFSMEAN
jgi:hypothetical protein